jgi:hypothetical protein
VKPFRSYTCPATQNTVRPDTYNVPFSTETYVYDLLDNAKNKKANGTSYEIFGTMAQLSANGATISLKKTDRSVNSKAVTKFTEAIGTMPGAAGIMLFLDADDTGSEGLGSTHNNWPDPEDNHGKDGTCMNFCDGHAQWIKRQDYLRVLNTSQDGNAKQPD